MITISLCMIVRDEEGTLERCLNSIKDVVDEIIIVDTGSVDSTQEIAKKFTDNLYHFDWIDDFAAARNYSFSKANCDYIMWLDADDIILEKDKYSLITLKQDLKPEINTVIMRYDLRSREDNHISSSFYRERIVKRSEHFKWFDPVHEYINFTGPYAKVDIAVTHSKEKVPTNRNLDIFKKYILAGNQLSERNWFYYARELFRVGDYLTAIEYYEKFLATTNGLHSNYLDSCINLCDCYILNNDNNNSLKSLTRYFEKFPPRAEICCKLGEFYKSHADYSNAIQWYSIAPFTLKPKDLGSYTPDCWDYIPYMELCACYYKIGDIDNAILYNEKAASCRPNDSKACHNREFLAQAKNTLLSSLS